MVSVMVIIITALKLFITTLNLTIKLLCSGSLFYYWSSIADFCSYEIFDVAFHGPCYSQAYIKLNDFNSAIQDCNLALKASLIFK